VNATFSLWKVRWDEELFKVGERRIYQPVLCSEFDGRIHVRPKPTHGSAIFASTIATLALPLDSGVNRKILHDPRRLLMPGIRTLDRLLALEDQQELRQRLHADAGLHALRRTFLTEAGEYTHPRIPLRCSMSPETITLGRSSAMDLREIAVHKLFARLADLQQP
jgi:hypothetical protein